LSVTGLRKLICILVGTHGKLKLLQAKQQNSDASVSKPTTESLADEGRMDAASLIYLKEVIGTTKSAD
jgi:hypothetical protein